MSYLLGLAATLLVGIVLTVLPLLLPWPMQLRWIIASNVAPQPLRPAIVPDSTTLTDVTVYAADDQAGHIVTWLASSSHGGVLRFTCPASDDAMDRLQQWCSDATPLLLVSPSDGIGQLHSDSACLLDLRKEGSA